MRPRLLCLLVTLTLLGLSMDGAHSSAAVRVTGDAAVPGAQNVELIGHFDEPIQALAVRGSYVYIGSDSELAVLDIANPAAPKRVGYLMLSPGPVLSVAVAGSYIYVLNGLGSELEVLDITSPAAPALVGSYTISGVGIPTNVAVAGNYAYITLSSAYHGVGGGGLLVLDVSYPASPIRVGWYQTLFDTASVMIVGKYAYIGSGNYGRYGLIIADISNPAALAKVGFYDAGGWVRDVKVAGRYAYITIPPWVDTAGYVVGGLRVLDVSNPATPRLAGSFDMPEGANQLALDGHYAYVTTWDGHLRVLDISDPTALVQVGSYPTGGAIAVAGGFIYTGGASSMPDGLSILHLTEVTAGGRVTDVNGMPFAGVTITAVAGVTSTTDVAGAYTFAHLPPGSYVLTPTLASYTFDPPTHTITLGPDAPDQNFTILPPPVETTLAPNAAATLVSTDTQELPTVLQIPAAAITQTTTLRLTPTVGAQVAGYAFVGHAFTLATERAGHALPELSFSRPLTVTIGYSATDTRVVSDTSKLALWRWAGSGWQDAAQSCTPVSSYDRDLTGRRLVVAICRTGRFALFGPTHQVYMPAVQR